MSTQAQLAANQANAQLSTGPNTEEGKAASSRNNLTHGLTYRGGMFVLLPWNTTNWSSTSKASIDPRAAPK